MQLRYGSYLFPANLTEAVLSREILDDDRGVPAVARVTADGSGTLLADGQANVAAACVALERALAVQFQDLVMLRDDGGIAWELRQATSLNGVRMKLLRYPDGGGGFEFVSGRTFAFSATADYPLTPQAGKSLLVSFREVLEFAGGGPERGMLRPVNAAPIPQTLYSHSPYLVVQSGEASALGAYPIAPGPKWAPVLLVRGPVFQKIGPQKSERGLVYAITWRYEFQSVTPLNGNPAAWIGSG